MINSKHAKAILTAKAQMSKLQSGNNQKYCKYIAVKKGAIQAVQKVKA